VLPQLFMGDSSQSEHAIVALRTNERTAQQLASQTVGSIVSQAWSDSS
jgi:hypothetical protein